MPNKSNANGITMYDFILLFLQPNNTLSLLTNRTNSKNNKRLVAHLWPQTIKKGFHYPKNMEEKKLVPEWMSIIKESFINGSYLKGEEVERTL